MVNEGQIPSSALNESYVAKPTLIESIKNAMQPEAIANKIGMDKNMLIDITLYGAIGFIIGFLLKKYSEYFISLLLLIIAIVILQQFDYISVSLNTAKIQELFGMEPMTIANDKYGVMLLEWIRANVAGSVSLLVGFLIGLKVA
ncbi:MAG TPA: FUN14 domain-containing protein [Candidatus Babeliales bacterium]|nr:FUN14 domain-containing protein [Candidatus Babeliales bacterium]